MKFLNNCYNTFKNMLNFLLEDTPTASAVKFNQNISLPSTEEELNKTIIQPIVFLTLRINLIKTWLNDQKNLYSQEEIRKKTMVGYSKESSKSLQLLTLYAKNIEILNKELNSLEQLHNEFLTNYKSYLKLYEITK
jgi:hypothetical protein